MNPAKREEASGFQFCVMHGLCEGQCLLCIRQGTCRTFPHNCCHQGQIPRCFSQSTLILIDFSYLQGLFKIETCLWLIMCLLDGQDCQTVERLADDSRVRFLQRIDSSKMSIEMFYLRGWKLILEML